MAVKVNIFQGLKIGLITFILVEKHKKKRQSEKKSKRIEVIVFY